MFPQAKLAPKLAQLKALEQKQALLGQGLAQYAENDPERINALSERTMLRRRPQAHLAVNCALHPAAAARSVPCAAPAAAVRLSLLAWHAEIGSVTAKDWANTWLGEGLELLIAADRRHAWTREHVIHNSRLDIVSGRATACDCLQTT